MARTNKYTSINFNDVYEKKLNSTTSSTAATTSSSVAGKYPFSPSTAHKSYSTISSRSNGMLVLSRPSPKPISQSQPRNPPPISPTPQAPPPLTDHETRFESDSISLRPLGKTGSGPLLSSPASHFPGLDRGEKEAVTMTATPKSDKFVPPHLRRGFVAKKEERQVGGFRPGGDGFGSSPTRHGEDGRPKSGGRYERVIGRKGILDTGEMHRPRSSENHCSSSG